VAKRIFRQYGVDFENLPDEALVRLAWLIALGILPFSPATLWRHVAAGKFPAPVKISPGVTAWRVGSIREWLKDPSGYRAINFTATPASQETKTARGVGK
jgi:prophage regulatory protein